MKKVFNYVLSVSLLCGNIATTSTISLPFSKKKNYTLEKFDEYDKEIDSMINDILLKTDFSALYRSLEGDLEQLYQKLSFLITEMEKSDDKSVEEKISDYKYTKVLLYKTFTNLNLLSEENAKTLLISTLFALVKTIKQNPTKTDFITDQNISFILNLAQKYEIHLKSTQILRDIMKTIDLKVSPLTNPLDVNDLRYEYAYYKIIEKIVNYLFDNKKDVLYEYLDKWSQRSKDDLKREVKVVVKTNHKNK